MRHRVLGFVAGLCALAACTEADAPTAPDAAGPAFAAASATTTSEVIPFSIGVFVACADGGAGEVVFLDGNLHIVSHTTANDNGFHVKSHFQPQALSGTGLTTGDKYQGTGVTQDEENVGPGVTYTFVNNFRMIGQGPGNNFLVHENVHVTVNANGDVTTSVDNFSTDCK